MKGAAEILRELVAIPSVSRMSNRPLVDAVARRLHAAGWKTREFSYADAHGVEKINLIARPAGQPMDAAEVDLAWVCHGDTVPFAAEWTAATELIERDGNLHGCGACDVKGALAGILGAIEKLAGDPVRTDCALVLTADEEIGCIGTERLLEAGAIRPRRVIVSEPTELAPAIAGKGYGLAEVTVTGRPAHSAFPGEGASAIAAAARLITLAYARIPGPDWPQDPLFTPSQTSINVGVVEAGSAKNIIAGNCEFLLEWRPVPGEDPQHVAEELDRLARQIEELEPGCTVQAQVKRAEPGFRLPGERLATELATFLETLPVGIAFSSEASRWARVAQEVVVIGPGDMRTAHSERECVPVSQLERWTACVEHLLRG